MSRPASSWSSCGAIGVERELGRAARRRQPRSRYHRPVSWSAWSSACVAARRSARRARSVNSVSRRLCSFFGRYCSSSLSAFSTSSLAAAPLAPARSRTARHGFVFDWPCSGARASVSAACSQRRAVAERERERLLAVAEAQPRGGFRGLGRDAVRLELVRELVGRRRVEPHGLAAAGDRRQHLRGLVGEEQQDDVGRRLLERLQQRVGGLLDQRVRALEHEDPVARLERRVRGGGDDRLVDVSAQHLVGAARRHPREVGVGAVVDAGLDVGRVLGAAGEQLAREGPCGLALAGARGAVQEVRVRGLVLERGAEHGARVGVGVERQHGRRS